MPIAAGGRTTCLTARSGTAESFRSHPVLAPPVPSATPSGGDAFGRDFLLQHRRQRVPLELYQAPEAFSYCRYVEVAPMTPWRTASFVFKTSLVDDGDDGATATVAEAAQSTAAATRTESDGSVSRRASTAGVTPSNTGQTKTSGASPTRAYKRLPFFGWALRMAVVFTCLV